MILRGRDAPVVEGHVAVFCQGGLIAIGDGENGDFIMVAPPLAPA